MRNLLILAVLAAILIVVNALSGIAAEWHYVVPATAGAVLYAETFDAAPADWELYEGRLAAQAEDGALHIMVDVPQRSPYSTANPHFADFDQRVQAKAVSGPLNNGFGVIFREQDPENYYLFLISSDGWYQVKRSVDGDQVEVSTWIESPLVNQGLDAENSLRVVAQGDTFRFYINDEPVELCIPDDPSGISTYVNGCIGGQMYGELVDSAIPSGQIGVVALALDEPGVEVAFDNVLVFGPAATETDDG